MNMKRCKNQKMKLAQLSDYTKAHNCTDVFDCNIGIAELQRYINENYPNVSALAYIRLTKLTDKLNKLKKHD